MDNDRCGRLSLLAQPGQGGLVRENSRGGWLRLVVFLVADGLSFSQAEQQSGTLIVAGHAGQRQLPR
jgi:hypothetical protein